ncbi:formylglycine-generating enzyme family protein [Pseudomonadota bacterium]
MKHLLMAGLIFVSNPCAQAFVTAEGEHMDSKVEGKAIYRESVTTIGMESGRKKVASAQNEVKEWSSAKSTSSPESSEGASHKNEFSLPLKVGGRGPTMIVIPSGWFRMGDVSGGGQTDETPVHRVTIEKAFAMSKTEITFDPYDLFVQYTDRQKPSDRGWGRGNRPVINVSWRDTVAYSEWLTKQTGKLYRLPSEAEWEYAARSGTETRYPWGDEMGSNNANCDLCKSKWDYKKTAPVGSFNANQFGLLDMHGNVWEWMQDCWHGNYQGAPSDGKEWKGIQKCRRRVIRGGSWGDGPRSLHSANRIGGGPDGSGNGLGFRLVQEL